MSFDSFPSTKPRVMNLTMLRSISNHQIFDPIIGSVSVNVVDYFVRSKLAINKLFYKLSVTSPSVSPVGVIPGVFVLESRLTALATKNPFALLVALVVSKAITAFTALKYTLSAFVVAIPRTKARLVGRWSGKYPGTILTDVFHSSIMAYNVRSVHQ